MEQPDRRPGAASRGTTARLRDPSMRAVVVGGALFAAGLAAQAVGAPGTFELALFGWVNGWPRPVGLPVIVVMQLGSVVAPLALAVALLVVRRREVARDVAVAGYAAWVVVAVVLKPVFGRGRPGDLLADAIVRGAPELSLAFPSGHAATAAAIVVAASPVLPPSARVLAWLAVGVAAAGRLYVGAHLPADVVGGVGVGLAVAGAYGLARRAAGA